MKFKYLWPLISIVSVIILQALPPLFISPEAIVINSNFFFGLIASQNVAVAILIFASIFVRYFLISRKKLPIISLWMILTGCVSNLLDRIFRGGATDYISLPHWPTFNIADILIVLGLIYLAIDILWLEKRTA